MQEKLDKKKLKKKEEVVCIVPLPQPPHKINGHERERVYINQIHNNTCTHTHVLFGDVLACVCVCLCVCASETAIRNKPQRPESLTANDDFVVVVVFG